MPLTPADFPQPETWIPNIEVVNDVGEGLLDVAVGALDLFPDPTPPSGESRTLAARYERRYVSHGTAAPVVTSKAKQITVVCTRIFIGRAGEERYQFVKGESGSYGYQTGQFLIELSAPWPAGVEPSGPGLSATTDFDRQRAALNRDAVVVFSAMMGLALGSVTRPWMATTPPPGSVRGDGMAVGPMLPRDPSGTAASWTCLVHVEL